MRKYYSLFPMAFYHKNFNHHLFEDVSKQDYNLVKNITTFEAKKLYRMHNEVCNLVHLKKGFMRFKISKHGILYTKTELAHNVVWFLLRFFKERNPMFVIVIEVNNFTYVNDGKILKYRDNVDHVVKSLENVLPLNELLLDIDNDDTIYREFFNSQNIKQRKNIKLMKKMMPLKYRDQNNIEGCYNSNSLAQYM